MKTAIIIPARFASQRFNGKPLVQIIGATGQSKTLIQRSWEAAAQVENIAQLIVTSDDQRILDHAKDFGADVMASSGSAQNGSERCAELVDRLDPDIDLIINFQGDSPLTPPDFVTAIIDAMADGDADMATPVLRCDAQTLARFRKDRKNGKVGGTTAVFDKNHHALYFSKEILPFVDGLADAPPVFHHVGLYGFRPKALKQYLGWPQGRLETAEGLEQLRFLENGAKIKCVEVQAKNRVFWEVNNPVDVERVEAALAQMGVA
ncbi:MAG: 3-deoxy-manno-octulosonate cytidylyltransferase [Rhodobacteraceae bacterium]|nr:3-deoxy-manno-octulosonate cytidylyltransferase [Paracoccaceae bacterium]